MFTSSLGFLRWDEGAVPGPALGTCGSKGLSGCEAWSEMGLLLAEGTACINKGSGEAD